MGTLFQHFSDKYHWGVLSELVRLISFRLLVLVDPIFGMRVQVQLLGGQATGDPQPLKVCEESRRHKQKEHPLKEDSR